MSYVFDCRTPIVNAPMTVDYTGLTIRPEDAHYIAITSPAADDDPDCSDLEEDTSGFETTVWPLLAQRVPAFAAIKFVNAWGVITTSTSSTGMRFPGPHPGIGKFYFCNGLGTRHPACACRAIAEHTVHGTYRSLDPSRLGFARIPSNRPLLEMHVV